MGLRAAVLVALSACLPNGAKQSAAARGGNVYGVSPTAVLLSWQKSSTADSYEIVSQDTPQSPTESLYPEILISGLATRSTEYWYSVYAVRGQGVRENGAIYSSRFRPWTSFAAVTLSSEQVGLTTRLQWSYQPWESGLTPSPNAANNTLSECALSKDLSSQSPFLDPEAVTHLASAMDQGLNFDFADLDPFSSYQAACRIKYWDGTTSESTDRLLLEPLIKFASCVAETEIGDASYRCPVTMQSTSRLLQLDPAELSDLAPVVSFESGSSTCAWANYTSVGTPSIVTGNAVVMGEFAPLSGRPSAVDLPGSASQGTCQVTIKAKFSVSSPDDHVSADYQIPLGVRKARSFDVTPSFAVRAISGALSYCENPASCPAPPSIIGDVISDFGYGKAYFAGGDTAFGAYASSPQMLYGFSPGRHFDVLSSASISGALVAPDVQITNATLKAAVGVSSGDTLFLETLLTLSMRPLAETIGRTPIDTYFSNGLVVAPEVTFSMPEAQHLRSYLVNGVTSRVLGDTFSFYDPAFIATDAPMGTTAAADRTFTTVSLGAGLSPIFTNRFTKNVAGVLLPTVGVAVVRDVECVGDVILDASLLLVGSDTTGKIKVLTRAEGCRIYSTKTLFVQGEIETYDIDDPATALPDAVVQLASARAVIFGFTENGGTDLLSGFTSGARGSSGPLGDQNDAIMLTSQASSAQLAAGFLDSIALDAQSNGASAGYFSVAADTLGTPLNANNIVVNAPVVLWNYQGLFSGSLVAEIALFPKQLNFRAELPSGTVILPLLTDTRTPLKVVDP